MNDATSLRPGDTQLDLPAQFDTGLYFIGHIRTPYATLADCPKNPLQSTCEAQLEVAPRFAAGLDGLDGFSHLIVLYWMDAARRDLIRQTPRHADRPRGVFSLRSPLRPNPIALCIVPLRAIDGHTLTIGPIDCRDRTPLIDIKPYLPTIDAVPDARRP